VILQQGSLLLAQAQELGAFYAKAGESNATTAEELLGRKISFEQAAGFMEQGFRQAWEADLCGDSTTPAEESEAEKYLPQVGIL
jgi:lipoate-protein ligase A